jgi:hypothetical protein
MHYLESPGSQRSACLERVARFWPNVSVLQKSDPSIGILSRNE